MKRPDDQSLVARVSAIARALDQSNRGEGKPMREFLEGLAGEHGISLK